MVHPCGRGRGCEMGRHLRSIPGVECSRGVRSDAGDGSMCLDDGYRRRGASYRRCNVVDDPMKRTLGVAAAVAEAEFVDPLKRTLRELAVAAEAEVDDLMNRPLDVAAVAGA